MKRKKATLQIRKADTISLLEIPGRLALYQIAVLARKRLNRIRRTRTMIPSHRTGLRRVRAACLE
jgi:hypothetical protein